MPIARLDSRARVRVAGPDARPFLHNLLTQDVEGLAPGQLRYGALLGPQGRLLFDLFLLGLEDGVLLDVAADRREALMQRLALYRLRAKVEIAPEDGPVFAAWGADAPADWPADPRLPQLGRRGYAAAEAMADEADYQAHRLALGVPDPAVDGEADRDFPIELNLDLLHGIDFRKGCFVGQEVTSRMKRRGTIKTRMLPIEFEGDPPAWGAEVLAGGLRAGAVRSGGPGRALALLRLDRIEGAELTVEGRTARVAWPEWIPRG